MKAGWKHLMLQRQGSLDQAGDSCSRVEMPHIGLDGTDAAKSLSLRTFPECLRERLDFDWITHRCTGAMCFDIADRIG